MEEKDCIRLSTIMDPVITKESLLWKLKQSEQDFFACTNMTETDIAKFNTCQKVFYLDQNKKICMLVQCDDYQRLPNILCLSNLEIFQGVQTQIFRDVQTHTKPFFVRAGLKIAKHHVYIARVPNVPQIIIGPQRFFKVLDAEIYCRKLLVDNRGGVCFQRGQTHEFLCSLLKRHHHSNFNTLTKDDINFFMIDTYQGQFTISSLYVVLKNGHQFPFNFVHCLRKPSFDSNLKFAFRRYVQPQTTEFRNTNITTFICCPICSSTDEKNSHVDHLKPQFAEMVNTFLATLNDAQRDSIVICGYGFDSASEHDCLFNSELDVLGLWITPPTIAEEWINYHKQHASLRLLCKTCNMARKRKDHE